MSHPSRSDRNWSKLQARGKQTEDDTETESFPRARALLSEKALLGNYEAIRELAKGQFILPMIKADAYGHGAVWAANVLKNEDDLFGFGVATLEEGREIREALGAKQRKTRILVLSGSADWSEEKGQFCERFGLTPTITSLDDWRQFLKQEWPSRLSYHLKFNTGMNRLGIHPGDLNPILAQLKKLPADQKPEGVATHMACAESPEHPVTKLQLEKFRAITQEAGPALPGTLFHLANSSAIWNAKKYALEGWTSIVRPGISLYGVPPWVGAPARGLDLVMRIQYRVAQRRKLQPGESIGYGATFRLGGKDPAMETAILLAGYADGLHRMNSNEGQVWIAGKSRRFLGIVSMDLSAIECDASVKVGDWAECFGPPLDPWTQAKAAGTIPYELLTSLSRRVVRMDDPER